MVYTTREPARKKLVRHWLVADHVAKDRPYGEEALRSRADVRQPHVVQQDFLDDERRHLDPQTVPLSRRNAELQDGQKRVGAVRS